MDFIKVFRTPEGEVVDVVKHTLKILKQHPDVEISIGTDSQNVKRKTHYVTVIAYRYNCKGVHYIYNKVKIPKIRDQFQRLFKEAEMSVEVAEWFTSKIRVQVTIDLDYNGDAKHGSHMVVSAAKGWANSLGYKVNIKPEVQVASRAADYHVR